MVSKFFGEHKGRNDVFKETDEDGVISFHCGWDGKHNCPGAQAGGKGFLSGLMSNFETKVNHPEEFLHDHDLKFAMNRQDSFESRHTTKKQAYAAPYTTIVKNIGAGTLGDHGNTSGRELCSRMTNNSCFVG